MIISSDIKTKICKFCESSLENNVCHKCGCITPERKVVHDDINKTFTDYCYNNYKGIRYSIYLLWIKFRVYLFVTNTKFGDSLNIFFNILTGGRPRLNLNSNEKFIDVGCGKGHFMQYLPKSWLVHGCDIVNYGIQKPNIWVGNFEKLEFKNKYSIVRASHSLEHSTNPKKFIDKLIQITEDNGLIIIYSPNSDSIAYKIFKRNWDTLTVESHFCILNISTLTKYLEDHGCKILYTNTYTLFSSATSLINYFKIRKSSSVFVLFAILLLPLTLIEYFIKKSDSFVIYARGEGEWKGSPIRRLLSSEKNSL